MTSLPISSPTTFLYKFVTPVGAGLAAVLVLYGLGVAPFLSLPVTVFIASPIIRALACLFVSAGALWQVRFSSRLRRLEMDNSHLFISDYRRQVVVPLREVAAVTENRCWVVIPLRSISAIPPTQGILLSFCPS